MMVTLKMPARLVFAGGIAVAITVSPVVAALAGPAISPPVSAVADPGQSCIIKQSNGSAYLDCGPSMRTGRTSAPSNVGAPSESALTAKN
jgi:hypothetical protein